ncbi:MAG TPA: MbtH family NRPS accessory protein [Paraburkholderia sp.]|uniref:MbtH family protein n=1 Tax=Paraburkholderia sp. TaxID=1926495 RepID=UPI002DEB4A46|nr:MbtH family NRPS accessory protein [Paraburkholderia sp.]
MSWDDENAEFEVVINQEEQYSIWPSYKQIPAGWQAVGKKGPKAEVLAYIEEHWTDMRPASLRKAMDAEAAANGAASPA